jgi:ribosomal protein S1
MLYMNIPVDLRKFFGDYLWEENGEKWEGVKSQVGLGSSVSGDVVARYPFGVFVDLGVGFPALLEVIQFERAGVFRCTAMETHPEVGSTVTATVLWFDDRQRQIKLTQRTDWCAPG